METFTFIEELNLVSLVDKCLVSSDVISRFTNIPLSETIILTVNLIKTFQPDQNISEKVCLTLLLVKHILMEQQWAHL